MRRVLMAVTAIAVLMWTLLTPSLAAAAGESVGGVVRSQEGGVPGVSLTVVQEGEAFTETAVTDETGRWAVDVPGAGTYEITLDTATLPEDLALTNPDRTSATVTLSVGQKKAVLFPTGEERGRTGTTADKAAQLLADGLYFGLIIALAAVGLSMIFGTTGLTNFSHGELVTLGALVTYVANNLIGLPFILAAALAVLACGALGYAQDRFFWRWLRHRGTGLIAMLVISIGLGIFLRYLYLFFFAGSTKQFADYSGQAGVSLGPVDITPKAMVGAGVAITVLVITVLWLSLTRVGKASRAIADNPSLASASGIDVERVVSVVWMVGAALAGMAGILYSLNNGVNWFMGFQILLLIFAGVTLGGLGTAVGAIVGSIIVGTMIQVSTLIIPSELKNVGALGILILILLFRPQGLFGRSERVG